MESLNKTIDSREVSEMVGKQHKELLRDIRKYVSVLTGAELRSSDFFIPSEYVDQKKEIRPCYSLTKKGCELVANKLTGDKGIEFTAKYVDRFNDMEIKLKDDPRERLKLMYQFTEDTAERVDVIEADLHVIKENQLLNEPDYSTISKMVRRKVNTLCTEQHLNQPQKAELFKDLNSGIKKITGVIARNRIKAKDFDKVIEFINMWQPSTATLTIIKQMSVFE